MEKFKKNNPEYFKNYYKKNKEKFIARNKQRSNKNIFYGIEINGTVYCFKNKKDIKIKRVSKHEIEMNEMYKMYAKL